jgi:hypothetical protein
VFSRITGVDYVSAVMKVVRANCNRQEPWLRNAAGENWLLGRAAPFLTEPLIVC